MKLSFSKTVALATLILVTLLLAVSPAGAGGPVTQQPQPFKGDRIATVMSQNLFFGADLVPVLTAPTPDAFVAAVSQAYVAALATDFPGRAGAIAAEIGANRPVLIGLQEAVVWHGPDPTNPATTVTVDFVQLILAMLAGQGLHYEAVAVVPGFDGEFPTVFGSNVQISFSDVILARADLKTADLKLSNIQTGTYATNLVIPSDVLGPVTIPRQWAAVDAKIRGKSFRFISTHLEAFSPSVRVAQAGEILAGPTNTGLPTILLGDFNAQPGAGDAADTLIAAGFADVWSVARSGEDGFTCCQAPDLTNPDSQLSQRIDLILARGGFRVIGMEIVGDDPADRTPSGRWPSDHAGVVATVQIPR